MIQRQAWPPAPGKSGSHPSRHRKRGHQNPLRCQEPTVLLPQLPRAAQDTTGCSWLSPPSGCRSRELPWTSFPKERGLGRCSSLLPRLRCTVGAELQCRPSRWDPEGFHHLEETLFLDPSAGQSPRALRVSRLQFWTNSLLGSKRGDLGAAFRGRGASWGDVKPLPGARLSKQGAEQPLPPINTPGDR